MVYKNIRAARTAADKTVTQTAKAIGLTVHGYRRWERGEVEPKASQCLVLAEFFDVSVDQLLTNKPKEQNSQRMAVSVAPGQRVILDVFSSELSDNYESRVRLRNKGQEAGLKKRQTKTA